MDSDLRRITRMIDFVPTCRWRDYDLRLEIQSDSVILLGAGASYGDEALRRAYPIGVP